MLVAVKKAIFIMPCEVLDVAVVPSIDSIDDIS